MASISNPKLDASALYEDVARSAQRFLSERPVIVLGTGATIPYGLPSVAELANGLLTSIKDNPPGWEDFSKRLGETEDLEQVLQEVTLPGDTVRLLVDATWEIVSSKDAVFYQQLLMKDVVFPLAELFRYLLRTADPHIRVVTTNYDRVAEYAANYVGAYVSTGVTPGWLQRFLPGSVDSERTPARGYEGQVTILKVHGSLDWFRNATDDVVGVPLSQSIPSNTEPLIVTPGTTKYQKTYNEPFRSVMAASDQALRKANCYVCVGYGFNDEHVQPVLVKRVLKDDIPLVIVTRTLTSAARKAFLMKPPKKFLFLEKSDTGTKIYNQDHPDGVSLAGVSVWEMRHFMDLVAGEGASK